MKNDNHRLDNINKLLEKTLLNDEIKDILRCENAQELYSLHNFGYLKILEYTQRFPQQSKEKISFLFKNDFSIKIINWLSNSDNPTSTQPYKIKWLSDSANDNALSKQAIYNKIVKGLFKEYESISFDDAINFVDNMMNSNNNKIFFPLIANEFITFNVINDIKGNIPKSELMDLMSYDITYSIYNYLKYNDSMNEAIDVLKSIIIYLIKNPSPKSVDLFFRAAESLYRSNEVQNLMLEIQPPARNKHAQVMNFTYLKRLIVHPEAVHFSKQYPEYYKEKIVQFTQLLKDGKMRHELAQELKFIFKYIFNDKNNQLTVEQKLDFASSAAKLFLDSSSPKIDFKESEDINFFASSLCSFIHQKHQELYECILSAWKDIRSESQSSNERKSAFNKLREVTARTAKNIESYTSNELIKAYNSNMIQNELQEHKINNQEIRKLLLHIDFKDIKILLSKNAKLIYNYNPRLYQQIISDLKNLSEFHPNKQDAFNKLKQVIDKTANDIELDILNYPISQYRSHWVSELTNNIKIENSKYKEYFVILVFLYISNPNSFDEVSKALNKIDRVAQRAMKKKMVIIDENEKKVILPKITKKPLYAKMANLAVKLTKTKLAALYESLFRQNEISDYTEEEMMLNMEKGILNIILTNRGLAQTMAAWAINSNDKIFTKIESAIEKIIDIPVTVKNQDGEKWQQEELIQLDIKLLAARIIEILIAEIQQNKTFDQIYYLLIRDMMDCDMNTCDTMREDIAKEALNQIMMEMLTIFDKNSRIELLATVGQRIMINLPLDNEYLGLIRKNLAQNINNLTGSNVESKFDDDPLINDLSKVCVLSEFGFMAAEQGPQSDDMS